MKLIKVLLVFVGLATVCGIWYLYKYNKPAPYKPNPIRPQDFPEILIPPDGAVSIDYSSPSNSDLPPHTYSLSFQVHDPYPSDKTRNFIEEHLRSKGWKRLNYDLMNPHVPTEYPPILYDLLQATNSLEKYKKEDDKYITWMEDWVNEQEESISVSVSCADPSKKMEHRNKPFVDLTFFGRESWIRPWISKYKELHPEEFDKGEDPCEIEDEQP